MQRLETFDPEPGLVTSLWGGPKTGKTALAFTWPGPWYYHETDEGGFERVKAHLASLDIDPTCIYREVYPLADHGDRPKMVKIWNRFVDTYTESVSLAANGAGTVIIDTESILWPITQGAFVDPKGKRGAMEYGDANANYRKVIGLARSKHANLVLIHQAVPLWIQDPETGSWKEHPTQLEPKAHKENLALVDIRIQTMKPLAGQPNTALRAKIEYSGRNLDIEGYVFDPSDKTPVAPPAIRIAAAPTFTEIALQLGIPT